MKDTVLKISLAGLLHDIGKFAERAFAVDLGDKDSVQQNYNYSHAFSTEQVLKSIFPECLEKRIDNSLDIKDCTVLNLAARHHKPRHTYEVMISEADRIASGHERAKADEASGFETKGWERKSQVPLLSILGRVRLKNAPINDTSKNMRYRITTPPLRHDETFEKGFPVTTEEYNAAQVRSDYKNHWQKFREAITGIDPEKQFETLFEVCRIYQWCLPASTKKEELPDVSLFEHHKVTAALASCLFLYHQHEGQFFEKNAIRDRTVKKYLLFCGDISGIQSFIYQISSKGAYKTLKGRSFFIQLLAEVLARRFIKKFGLTIANILYSSGGKFYLLLPCTKEVEHQLVSLADEINFELFNRFNGDLFIRTGYEPLSGDDLTGESGKNLSQIWSDLGQKLLFEDRTRYSSLARRGYDNVFGFKGNAEYISCEVCHQTIRPRKANGANQCKCCREMMEIGRKLGTSKLLVMANNETAIDGHYDFSIFDNYFWFIEAGQKFFSHKDCLVWTLNDLDFIESAKGSSLSTINAAPMIVGSTHRFNLEFEEVAGTANGRHRLGILRMDVDNLGQIFGHGLGDYIYEGREKPGRFHSLGRITTLSWQLSLFFGTMVPALIRSQKEWKDRVTVVYSGGDDLFLLGAWDAMPKIALAVRKAFSRFCCQNPSWGLSGGVVMTGGKFPVYKSAEMAGEAEEKAKKFCIKINGGRKRRKNAFTFFDTVMGWDEFDEITRVRGKLYDSLEKTENRPLLSRLRDINASWTASRDKMRQANGMLTMTEINKNLMAEKWRWRMVYSLKRLGESRKNLNEAVKDIQQFILNPVAGGKRHGIEFLGVVSRWCELELSKPQNSKGGE